MSTENVKLKKTISAVLTLFDLENYLVKRGWKKTVTGWAFKDGHEMLNASGLQGMLDQLAFIERRDSFSVHRDITECDV
jgi:hypothetical protein